MKKLALVNILILQFILVAGALPAAAQTYPVPVAETSFVNFTPQFFICLLAGVILAVGFQVLLTTLSVASGISMVGNLEKQDDRPGAAYDKNKDTSNKKDTNAGVKISSAIGIWSVLTVSASLFFASLLAVKLSMISSNAIGVTLGLVIWAAFFSLMVYFEVKAVSSLLGGLVSTVFQGVRSTFGMAKDMITPSAGKQVEDIAKHTVDEIVHAFEDSNIEEKLDKYVKKLQPQEMDYGKIRQELVKLINDMKIEQSTSLTGSTAEREIFIKVAEAQPSLTKKDVEKLKEVYAQVQDVMRTQGSASDKVMMAVDRLVPGASEEDVKSVRGKIEQYLRDMNRDEVSPERLKGDLEAIINDPGHAKDVIMNRLNMIDRSTVVAMLSSRTDMSQEQAEKIVGYVVDTFNNLKDKVANMVPNPNANMGNMNMGDTMGQNMGATATATMSGNMGDAIKGVAGDYTDKFEQRLRDYFAALERPEFDYDHMKRDFLKIFSDPKSGLDVIKDRLGRYDRNSLVALLSSNKNITPEQAERIVSKMEEARNTVLDKARSLEQEVQYRTQQAKEMALHQAEKVRQTAASAAWWLLAGAVISGIASALGGMLAITI